MKIVTKSMSSDEFSATLESAPTEAVTIEDIKSDISSNNNSQNIEQPVIIGYEENTNKDLYLKIYDFNSLEDIKVIINDLKLTYKYISENDGNFYNLTIGPLKNIEANKLVLTFISRGYKNTKFLLN